MQSPDTVVNPRSRPLFMSVAKTTNNGKLRAAMTIIL